MSKTASDFQSPNRKKVFISYSQSDGRDFARDLRQKLNPEFEIWQDVISLRGAEDWWKRITDAIEAVDQMVLLLSPGSLKSNVVRREWAHARRVGTPIIPVVIDQSVFEDVPRWVHRTHHIVLDPSNPYSSANFAKLLTQLHDPVPVSPIVNLAPPLPLEFTERRKLQGKLRLRLLSADETDPSFGIVALFGIGGFGKTTLAQAFANDPDVIEAYTGGVYWVTVGEQGEKLNESLNNVLRALDKPAGTSGDLPRRVKEALDGQDCLMILDDVWDEAHIRPLIDNRIVTCSYLLTTRERTAAAFDNSPITVEEMETEEAAALLSKYLPDNVEASSARDRLVTLSMRLGEWPLLLNIFGAELKTSVIIDKQALSDALTYIEDGLTEQGLTVFDRTEVGRNRALNASMQVSLKRFTSDEQLSLFEMAIFPPDTTIPESAVVRLWSTRFSQFAAKNLIKRLAGQFCMPDSTGSGIRFHDRMREYLEERLNETSSIHDRLLYAYNPSNIPWHEVADSYLLNSLVYHLRGAKRDAELNQLFLDDSWMRQRFQHNGYTYEGFLADLEIAWSSVAIPSTKRQIECNNEPDTIAHCLRYALIRASITSISGNYSPSLVFEALNSKKWSLKRAMEVMTHNSDDENKARLCIVLLASQQLNEKTKRDIEAQALQASLRIRDSRVRSDVLSSLVSFLSQEQLREVYSTVGAIQLKLSALDFLFIDRSTIGTLAGERDMKAALEIRDYEHRAFALSQLSVSTRHKNRVHVMDWALNAAQYLSSDQSPNVSRPQRKVRGNVAKQIQFRTFRSIAKRIPESLVDKCRLLVQELPDPRDRAYILFYLSRSTRGYPRIQLLHDMLVNIDMMHSEFERDETILFFMRRIARITDGALLERLSTLVSTVSYPTDRAIALASLSRFLSDEKRENTIQTVVHLLFARKSTMPFPYDESSNFRASMEVAHYLPPPHQRIILTEILNRWFTKPTRLNLGEVGRYLTMTNKLLSSEFKQEFLSQGYNFLEKQNRNSEVEMSLLLLHFAHALGNTKETREWLQVCYNNIAKIQDSSERVNQLITLARFADEQSLPDMLSDALRDVANSSDIDFRIYALLKLIPFLPLDRLRGAILDVKESASLEQQVQFFVALWHKHSLEEHKNLVYLILLSQLQNLRGMNRGQVLDFIVRSPLFMKKFFSETTLEIIAYDIIDVCWRWQWQ